MPNAFLDENSRPSMTALLNTDGSTITRVQANPSNHGLEIIDGTTGSDNGNKYEVVDENSRPILWALSNADGVTPIALYVDSTGHLLVKST